MTLAGRKMIQVLGTSSGSGKTTITTALCRILNDMGYSVAPFKAVNMSLNSISLPDGSEFSRSVWLQAKAARTEPCREMNPFLLKPERSGRSQLIVLGRSMGTMDYTGYSAYMGEEGPRIIRECIESLWEHYDVILAEGAGSAAEINFRGKDLANSFVSSLHGTPSLLVGDIDRGGVFASLLGSVELMEHPETLRWMVINRMRGDRNLLKPGIELLQERTEKKVIGVIPYVDRLNLPGEDSLDYEGSSGDSGRICVVRYPFMENLSEVDPLMLGRIGFTYVGRDNASSLEDAEVIILPGSKDVVEDLRFLRETGMDQLIVKSARNGKKVLGICGGYQILGKSIDTGEREGIIDGLDLLDCRTEYSADKNVRRVYGMFNPSVIPGGPSMEGYEIHYGIVTRESGNFLCSIEGTEEGTVSHDMNIIGTNVHGLLENASFLRFITDLEGHIPEYSEILENNLAELSAVVSRNMVLDGILRYLESE